MQVGITGTRGGLPQAQREKLRQMLIDFDVKVLHQGDCIGVDAEAGAMAKELGILVVSHPPLNPKYRAFAPFDVEHRPADYLIRNEHIVNAAQLLIGVPRNKHEVLRSGTWACIRYARRVRKPIHIIYPDGNIEVENT